MVTDYYKKHSKDLALNFYLTLRTLLKENPDCGDHCQLLFFDGKWNSLYLCTETNDICINKDIDETGEYVDVGDVILTHLKQIKKDERKHEQKEKLK